MRKHLKKFLLVFVSAYCGLRRRLRKKTVLLFYGNNVMNYTMFRPLFERIKKVSRSEVFFCFDTADADFSGFVRLGVPPAGIISLARARLRIWDAIVFADFRKPRYLWFDKLVYICHGVAAKLCAYQGENGMPVVADYRYHHSTKEYDLVFYHNEEDYRNARRRNLFKHPDSGQVVGMCCLDEVVQAARSDEMRQALKKKYIPARFLERRVILYAPTWNDASSFKRKGREILSALANSEAFVIIKPHPLCIISEVGDSGLDLKSFLQTRFRQENYLLVTDTPYEVMPISDMIISDFSSITFEYTLLRKPVILFEPANGGGAVADKKQYDLLRRCCFILRETDEIGTETFRIPHVDGNRLNAMEELRKKYFANPGKATDVAMRKLIEHGVITPKPLPEINAKPAGT